MNSIENKIKLNPIEATAFWWVKMIRNKVREINRRSRDFDELRFADLFDGYKEEDWRNLYLRLVDLIEEDMREKQGKYFQQETAIRRHNNINIDLSCVIKDIVPDIDISPRYSKSNVIFTSDKSVSVGERGNAIAQILNRENNPWYTLTGDEDDLKCYYLLAATLAVIDANSKKYESKPLRPLKTGIVNGYKKYILPEFKMEKLRDSADLAIEYAEQNGIIRIINSATPPIYETDFTREEYNGLEPYMDKAMELASVILNKDPEDVKSPYSIRQ